SARAASRRRATRPCIPAPSASTDNAAISNHGNERERRPDRSKFNAKRAAVRLVRASMARRAADWVANARLVICVSHNRYEQFAVYVRIFLPSWLVLANATAGGGYGGRTCSSGAAA